MSFDFSGKKILVTGAGRGIGRELVKAIVSAGGEVYALGRTKENTESLTNELCNIHPIIVDLNDWESTRTELAKLDALDGVVNNVACLESFVEAFNVKQETLQEALRVNVIGSINVLQITAKINYSSGQTWINC